MRAHSSLLVIAASAALGGCAYGMDGYGSPLGGVSVGVGYGSGYGSYGSGYGGYGSYGSRYGGYDPFCHPYGYGSYASYGSYGRYPGSYGSGYGGCVDPYWGWYGDHYYPGSGYYVYDRYRRPYRWTDAQRRYWQERRRNAEPVIRESNGTLQARWDDFARHVNDKRLGRTGNTNQAESIQRQQIQRRALERQAERSAATSNTDQAQSTQRQQIQRRALERQAERSARSSARERAAERRERVRRDDTRPERRDD
jgi:hypothetical protein